MNYFRSFMRKDRFIAYDAYKKLAERYAEIVDVKPHNAEYERPGLLRVMPEVEGKMVLDAGCGSGSLTRWRARALDHRSPRPQIGLLDIQPEPLTDDAIQALIVEPKRDLIDALRIAALDDQLECRLARGVVPT